MALLGASTYLTLAQILRLPGARSVSDFDKNQSARSYRFALNDGMLDNTAYRLGSRGGYRENILEDTFDLTCTDETPIVGCYNPVRTIVDAYQNVFRGVYGQDIRVDEKVDERDVNQKLSDVTESPIRKLWKWSNLDTEKTTIQEWAANHGTVGLCIRSQESAGNFPDKRVYIRADHPGNIVGFSEDERGNVTEVELKYTIPLWSPGDDKVEERDVREVFTKTRHLIEQKGLPDIEVENDLGVCPYVILRHATGHTWGRWAYDGSEDIIHFINWILTNQGHSVYEHSWPEWFAATTGKPPANFPLGRKTVKHIQMDSGANGSRVPSPIFEPLVADVDQAGSLAYVVELMTRLQERQPEIAVGNVKALAGQSGETIAKLLIPAEAAIMRARANYEHALIRAMQIAISEGIRLSLWDVGSGTGTVEAADKAYRTGLEDFAFAERPALPQSAYDQITQAKAAEAPQASKYALAKQAQGLGVDQETVLDIAGFSQEEIRKILRRKSTADVIPTEPL